MDEGNNWQGEYKPLTKEPYDWGNKSLWTVDPISKLLFLQYEPPLYAVGDGDTWFLLKLEQSNALDSYKK